jgi:hypothetical protein
MSADASTPDGSAEPGDRSKYKDPGTGPWEMGTPEACKMDPTLFEDSALGNYAVFRYGKLCHIKGGDSVGQMFSATKTLGGVTAGRCAQMAKDVPKTGPGTGTISPEDPARDWIASARQGATISHVMAMVAAASTALEESQLRFRYDTVGAEAINGMVAATEKCAAQVGAPTDFSRFMRQEVFEKLGMSDSSYSAASGIGTGWSANVLDMGRLGTMLVHDGWYNGEQLLSPVWVYRMSHPAFESANTAYGHLAWVNHRGGSVAPGGATSSGDSCAPAAFWQRYPHFQSEAADCNASSGGCEQMYDVGVFSARGLGGQEITMHPGLDLVIVARNYSGGVQGMWAAVRPGLVAMDPMFKGDEDAFCEAYGSGNYAPDLLVARDDGL